MGITKEFLLNEQASLEQQQTKHRQTLEKAKFDLEAVSGAMQMVSHLLKQFEATATEATENRNEEKS